MAGLKFIRKYIDDLLVMTMSTWEDHLQCLKIVFQQLLQAGLKVNAQKSFFWPVQIGKIELLDYSRWYPTRIKQSGGDQEHCSSQNSTKNYTNLLVCSTIIKIYGLTIQCTHAIKQLNSTP
jgi:hypothetical protein